MRKWIIAAVVAVALFSIGAFAASFALSADDVGSGADAVTTCASTGTNTVQWVIGDTDAVTVTPSTSANFTLDRATVTVPNCGSGKNIELALERTGTTEVHCRGTTGAGGVKTFQLGPSATECTQVAVTVAQTVGAALFVGDQPVTYTSATL